MSNGMPPGRNGPRQATRSEEYLPPPLPPPPRDQFLLSRDQPVSRLVLAPSTLDRSHSEVKSASGENLTYYVNSLDPENDCPTTRPRGHGGHTVSRNRRCPAPFLNFRGDIKIQGCVVLTRKWRIIGWRTTKRS